MLQLLEGEGEPMGAGKTTKRGRAPRERRRTPNGPVVEDNPVADMKDAPPPGRRKRVIPVRRRATDA